MTWCSFQKLGAGIGRWKCETCGFVTHAPMAQAPRRQCPKGSSQRLVRTRSGELDWVRCPFRNADPQIVNGRSVSCGCGQVAVYHCSKFEESVLLRTVNERGMEKLQSAVDTFQGRTCKECREWQPELVFVTAYFNPQNSQTRRANYDRFARGLSEHGISLFTVEACRKGERTQLASSILAEVGDVLWHKERLLNWAVSQLPDYVKYVGWVDADLLFDCKDLKTKIIESLRVHAVIQPWSQCCMLGADGKSHPWCGQPTASSLAAVNDGKTRNAYPGKKHPGFAWVARRDVLEQMGGLYDRHVTGGGDAAMALAFYGDFESQFLSDDRMSPKMLANWRAWAERAYAAVRANVGYVDCTITHLYHGEIADRHYKDRWTKLARLGYDPTAHVRNSPTGGLEWTERAPEPLKAYVQDYLLRQRKEP